MTVAEGAAVLLVLSSGLAVVNGQKALSPSEQDKALAAIGEYALNYAKGLPDYSCTRVTQQKSSAVIVVYTENPELFGQHPQDGSSWTVNIKEDLTIFGKRETYKLLKVDNNFPPRFKPPPDEAFGTISAGEFGSVLNRIFEPETGAGFQWVRSGKLRDRPVIVFSIEVPRSHGAHVRESVVKRDVVVGYKGLVYADAESKAVLRIETHSSDFPGDSEFRSIDLALDYKAAMIAGHEFVLPYRFDLEWHRHVPGTLAKARRLPQESSVEAEYKNYRKFSAQSAVDFGGPDSQGDIHSAIMFGDVTAPDDK